MPIKGMSPKATMHKEMHEFKTGNLHSGSKSGPVVKNRKQAIAIGLSEARKARPGHGGPDPIERSVAGPDVALPHQVAGRHYDGGFVEYLPKAAQNVDRAPAKLGAYPAPLPAHARHGYGHDATQHSGHLRNSGDPRAHRIGKR
jgi:Family of unknown function (DUF6496)